MIPVIILLLMLHVFQVKPALNNIFEDAQKVEVKYLELVEVTAYIASQNTIEQNSNYVASIGANDEHHVGNKVLQKIHGTSIAVASPSEMHGLAINTIIFAGNQSSASILKIVDKIHGRGRLIVCVTILFSSSNEFHEQFTQMASDFWANRVSRLIFVVWVAEELNVFGLQPYAEKTCFPTNLIKIGVIKKGIISKKKPFFAEIKNLNACPLRVCTTTGMPYVEIYVEGNMTRVRGIEGNILNVLSSRMNFTSLIVDVEKLPGFDSRFNDSKDELMSNNSDLCFGGKKVNVNRIEPTVSIMDCQKIWVVPKSGTIAPWMQEVLPFQPSVWMMLGFTLLVMGGICLFVRIDERASLLTMWSLFLGVSVEMRGAPVTGVANVFLTCWLFFSYVITRSYLASLEGFLTKPNLLPDINTLEELIASQIPMGGHPVVVKLYCDQENSEMSRIVCARYRVRNMEEISEEIKADGKIKSAFIMKSDIFKNSKFFRDYETHVMREVLLKYPIALLVQTGAPFLDEMNNIVIRLIEAGFVDLWQRDNILIQPVSKHYPKKLKIEHVAGITSIAALGYAISIVVFCLEYLSQLFDFRTLFVSHNRG